MLTFMITTSTKRASLSLFKNDVKIGEMSEEVQRTHSTTILGQIEKLLKDCGVKIDEIKNVIVSIGPGSFTGVRIAISVVKGMFYGREVNIYEVNELDALAHQVLYRDKSIKKGDFIYSGIDSFKEKVYYGVYEVVSDKKLKLINEYEVSKLDKIIENILENDKRNIYVVGDITVNYESKITENIGEKIILQEMDNRKINASIFYEMFKNNLLKEVDLFSLKPDYLEKSQAERDKENV